MTGFRILLLLVFPRLLTALSLAVSAESAILMNADTGAVLFEKNSTARSYPASTIKMATALYAFEKKGSELDSLVVADHESLTRITPKAKKEANYDLPAYWLETDAKLLNIKMGEAYTLKELLAGTLVASGGDSANLVARFVSGSITKFMTELNDFLQEIGCEHTHVMNPHGLHHPKQITTARDLACIAQRGLANPLFREVVRLDKMELPQTAKQKARMFKASNKLVRKGKEHYSYAIGVKTGFTGASRNTFVAAAEKDGRTLIAVLLKVNKRAEMWKEAKKLFEAAFNEKKVHKQLFAAGPQKIEKQLPGGSTKLRAFTKEAVKISYYPSEQPNLTAGVHWKELTLPIAEGQEVGELVLTASDQVLEQRTPLYAVVGVERSWSSVLFWPFLGLGVLGLGFFVVRR